MRLDAAKTTTKRFKYLRTNRKTKIAEAQLLRSLPFIYSFCSVCIKRKQNRPDSFLVALAPRYLATSIDRSSSTITTHETHESFCVWWWLNAETTEEMLFTQYQLNNWLNEMKNKNNINRDKWIDTFRFGFSFVWNRFLLF